MPEFLEEITRENIKVGDFVIRNPKRGKVYLGIVDKVNGDVLSIGTNHGDNVDRSFTMGYLINTFKKIKKGNITEINDLSGHYFYIQEPVLRKDFYDTWVSRRDDGLIIRDSILSIVQHIHKIILKTK